MPEPGNPLPRLRGTRQFRHTENGFGNLFESKVRKVRSRSLFVCGHAIPTSGSSSSDDPTIRPSNQATRQPYGHPVSGLPFSHSLFHSALPYSLHSRGGKGRGGSDPDVLRQNGSGRNASQDIPAAAATTPKGCPDFPSRDHAITRSRTFGCTHGLAIKPRILSLTASQSRTDYLAGVAGTSSVASTVAVESAGAGAS